MITKLIPLLFLFAWTLPAVAATKVCGNIPLATDWTPKNSPYIVTNDIYVPLDSRLTILPGVVVKFARPGECKDSTRQMDWADSNYSGLKIEGLFYAKGTKEQPVIFESEDYKPGQTGWDGIRIWNKNHMYVKIEHTIFRGANKGLQLNNCQFAIKNSVFEHNNTGINMSRGNGMEVYNCNFISNKSCGIQIISSAPDIQNSIFAYNHSYGIWSDSRPRVRIQYNDFWENTDANCYKCPREILQMVVENDAKDSTDVWSNVIADPVFISSDSYKNFRAKDLTLDTDTTKVQDKKLAKIEKKHRKSRLSEEVEEPVKKDGPYMLSKYSTLINAGNPSDQFKDADGTRNDIGIYGSTTGNTE
ncbi:MAG: right-handed parallel beta-helix repeat-containing protein [Fibrobacteria bacterium]|nr:right-handed parallel beta-helix repeat-containing protein [Fibrobacteria bacterium]